MRLEAPAQGQCGIEEIGFLQVHQHRAAQDAVERATRWRIEPRQHTLGQPACEFRMALYGRLS